MADALEVHISTISRGVSGKHAQTPNGIFPLKFFFAGGTTKSTGETTSRGMGKTRAPAAKGVYGGAARSQEATTAQQAVFKGVSKARQILPNMQYCIETWHGEP